MREVRTRAPTVIFSGGRAPTHTPPTRERRLSVRNKKKPTLLPLVHPCSRWEEPRTTLVTIEHQPINHSIEMQENMPVAPPLSVLSAQVTPSGLECSQSGYTITVSDSDGLVVSQTQRCVFLQIALSWCLFITHTHTHTFIYVYICARARAPPFASTVRLDTHRAVFFPPRCFEEFGDLMLALPTLRTGTRFPSRKSG